MKYRKILYKGTPGYSPTRMQAHSGSNAKFIPLLSSPRFRHNVLKSGCVVKRPQSRREAIFLSAIQFLFLQSIESYRVLKNYLVSLIFLHQQLFWSIFLYTLYVHSISIPPSSTHFPSGASLGDPVTPASKRVIQLRRGARSYLI